MQTQLVPIAQLVPSPFNPRKAFDKENMAGLVESVKAHGILEPILVRPFPNLRAENPVVGYQIIAGWRRYLAAQKAGLSEVPCTIHDVTDAEARELQMIENVQREGINEWEEAQGYQALIDKIEGYDVAKVAAKVGKSQSYIYQRLKLLDLAKPVKEALQAGTISAGHGILLARLEPEAQKRVLDEVVRSAWTGRPAKKATSTLSVRDTAALIKSDISHELSQAPWELKDAALLSKAGACQACKKNTATSPLLYPDIKTPTCTDGVCWKAKLEAFLNRARADAKRTVAGRAGRYVELTWSDYAYNCHTKLLKTRNEWREANATCDHAHVGVVVEGEKEVGRVKHVCIDCYCKEHWGKEAWAKPPRTQAASDGKSKAVEKLRQATYRQLIKAVIAKTTATLTTPQLRWVAQRMWSHTSYEANRGIAVEYGWAKGTVQDNCLRIGSKRINTLLDDSLAKLIVRIVLVAECPPAEQKALLAAYHLDPRKIQAEAKAALKPAPKPKPAAIPKPKAKAKAKPKAKLHTSTKPAQVRK